jgi:hypothetical protein
VARRCESAKHIAGFGAFDRVIAATHLMSLATGSRLGVYEIVSLIGAGGMGERVAVLEL